MHLRNALKKACDEDLGNEWRSACASLFVVEGSTDAASGVGLAVSAIASRARVRADVFYDGEHNKFREVLVGEDEDDQDADASSLIDRDVRRLCSPWRAARAPAFARLVDHRLRRGLKACRKDTERLLKATNDALHHAPTHLEASIRDLERTQSGRSPREDEGVAGLLAVFGRRRPGRLLRLRMQLGRRREWPRGSMKG